jgi:hypothetical protein
MDLPVDNSRISPEMLVDPADWDAGLSLAGLQAGAGEDGHLYGGRGTASDLRSGLWVVEVLSEVALVVAEVDLVVAEVDFVLAG